MIGERVGIQGACQMIGESVGTDVRQMISESVDIDDNYIFS